MNYNGTYKLVSRCGAHSAKLFNKRFHSTKKLTVPSSATVAKWKILRTSYYTYCNFNKRCITTLHTQDLTQEKANEIIFKLNATERDLLRKALVLYESKSTKTQYEGQLAATRWRSRFGRPSKVPSLGDVDITGSYCAVPEDWLQKKFAESTPPPTSRQLLQLIIVNGLPFIGFGFLDNFMMIICGDYIEQTLGGYMCLSTMAAAGLGNTISDVFGLGSAVYVERFTEAVGVKTPPLTQIQLQMKSSRRSSNFGRILGITMGCLIGMFPLLFIDTDKKKEEPQPKSPSPVQPAQKQLSTNNL